METENKMVTFEELFGVEGTPMPKPPVKEKKKRVTKSKEPSLSDLLWERRKSKERLAELEAQDETGWSDSDLMYKGKVNNIPLVKNHIAYYTEKIMALRQPYNQVLNKYKDYIIQLCAEEGQEIDLLWYSTSAPYDYEISIRLKNHRCWNDCVSLRFEKEELRAYDSHWGSGTSWVSGHPKDYSEVCEAIKEILSHAFKKECSDNSWEDSHNDGEHRNILIDEEGWDYGY